MVLYVDEFRVSRSLRKRVKRGEYELRINYAFGDVIANCASALRAGQTGTWISPAIVEAYCALHKRGFAHSVESWCGGRLVGGLYGIALGRVFFGESMFSSETDASKVALVGLVDLLRRLGVPLVDCQQETPHLASFGAKAIPRLTFAAHLAELINSNDPPSGWPIGVIVGAK
jgi:leucyl/phenylalanyl-tRNA--protein transferase